MEGSHLGLGYIHHYGPPDHHQQQSATGAAQHQPLSPPQLQLQPTQAPQQQSSVVNDIDAYMNHYLQQCMQYHEEKEALRKNPTQKHAAQLVQQQSTTQFVAGGIFHETPASQTDNVYTYSQPKNKTAPTEESRTENESSQSSVDNSALEGRQRAQEILKRFQQHQEHLLYASSGPDLASVDSTCKLPEQEQQQTPPPQHIPAYHCISEPPEPSLFLEQRRRGMQREIQNKKRALLKNFEYIAEKELQRSQLLQDQIAHARNMEQQARLQYEAATLRRKHQQQTEGTLQTQAGIGTKKRKKVERIKEKTGHVPLPSSSNSQDHHVGTVAVYVSGLPTDGSVTQELISDLFGSFGDVQKVHFYREKKTGDLKGDGLVIFNVEKSAEGSDNQTDGSDLVEMVCSQMNGAELSQGVRLNVEPSSSNKKPTPKEKESSGKMAATQPFEKEQEAPPAEANQKDEELDDFFNSL